MGEIETYIKKVENDVISKIERIAKIFHCFYLGEFILNKYVQMKII